jgi:hypothetical protein
VVSGYVPCLTQTKSGISALELKRMLGVNYCTAWSIKHKLMQVMKERDNSQSLVGIIQLDDAYWGGERHGGKHGRGAPNVKDKPWFATLTRLVLYVRPIR